MDCRHCRTCEFNLDWIGPGAGDIVSNVETTKISVVNENLSHWHPSICLCVPAEWEDEGKPILRQNIRLCSRFKIKGDYKNVWKE